MESLLDGVKLLGLGITTTFLFLILVVAAIEVTRKLIKPFEHLLEKPAGESKPAGVDPKLVAAALAAADLHKKS
ncbi:hypothetical protein SDC9_152501 [bioreactor metagenome]|uniref:Oxaloacetate decarboxylase gamma chain n=1 Tax=bioreactor metagenome TaxID=1076179 RepID=A0A645ET81_9ZZZZ